MKKWFRCNQLWRLISASFLEIIREPGVLFWGILFPILMTLGLGIAFTKKTDVIRKVAVIRTNEVSIADTSRLLNFLEKKCKKDHGEEKDRFHLEVNDRR